MTDKTPHTALWQIIRDETEEAVRNEPILAGFLHLTVLRHRTLAQMLAFHLSGKVSGTAADARVLYETYLEVLNGDATVMAAVLADLAAYYERDPACDAYSTPLLYFKGFHAVQVHRINHCLWLQGRKTLALFLQNRSSEVFGVDIHPAARIGHGIMIDHGTGVVIGETAVLGNDISMLHGVTLGGSGKESGDRHPKIEDGVMLGANASVLGNILVGRCAKIGAGSVVVEDIPAYSTAVGVPARVISRTEPGRHMPAAEMDQRI